jgi:hypothetical protein
MKRILLGIAVVISVAVIIVLVLALGQPDDFQVQRQIAIAAPAAAIYPNLDDFHRWEAWSPWEKIEPGMKKTYSGPASGTGSSYAWEGKEVGSGNMTVTESKPSEHLQIRLEFTKPFAAVNNTAFDLKPLASDTQVSWVMTGRNNFVSKIMCVFTDMDTMIGKDFEAGLNALKQVSESAQ